MDYCNDGQTLTCGSTTEQPRPRWRCIALSFTPWCWGLWWDALPSDPFPGELCSRNIACFDVCYRATDAS